VAGLDGIRAIAVLAVIGYHLNFSWAQGGKLGVGVFFTLSGYLITDLLLGHFDRTGSLDLKKFWIRRARRLLPALFVMLAVVSVFTALFDAAHLGDFRKQVLAAGFYVSNWQTIIDSGSYFARFAPPLPLDHLWSLAIEEQFYLVWPWLLWAGVRWVRDRTRLGLLTFAGAIVSAVAMALIYSKGQDPTRVYEGTDTRAFELLFGAAVAFVWPTSALTARIREGARNLLDLVGGVCLAGILILIASTGSYSSFLYPWGFVLLSIATAVLVAVVVHPASRLGRWLGWEPLRWIGVRSYGIYLWQWPIIVFTTPAGGGVNVLRGAGQVALTLLISSLSWRWIEEPIRRGGFRRYVLRLRVGAARVLAEPRRGMAIAGAAVLLLLLPFLGLAGALPEFSRNLASAQTLAGLPGDLAKQATTPAAPATTTSCRSVVYIGDSTSEGSISTNFIPNPAQRLEAQLAAVGVTQTTPYISGARDIVEDVLDAPNATGVARQILSTGFSGCWILALGTNDAATIALGGTNLDQSARIAQMMSEVGDQPAMWVGAVSRRPSPDPYSSENMQLWNKALQAACVTYPNMRIFDWAGVARPEWFQEDGLHYTTPGYIAKTNAIAQGLVHAFPAGQPASQSCVVQ
jgi:peptidoglycan/LPS O-acetylase OafA/YrhL/lysophospholipase L1-like esterase